MVFNRCDIVGKPAADLPDGALGRWHGLVGGGRIIGNDPLYCRIRQVQHPDATGPPSAANLQGGLPQLSRLPDSKLTCILRADIRSLGAVKTMWK